MRLDDHLFLETIAPRLQGRERDEVLAELASHLAQRAPVGRGQIFAALRGREDLSSTALEHGVAIPHCRLPSNLAITVALGVAHHDVAFNAPDGAGSRIFAAMVSPLDSRGEHLKVLSRLSQILRSPQVRTALLHAKRREEMLDVIRAEDARLDRENARRFRPGAQP